MLAALVPVSNRLLRHATEVADLDSVTRTDLDEIFAWRADLAFLRGTGGSEPTGIRSITGVTVTSLGTDGATPDYDDLKDVVSASRIQNAPFLQPGWLFHPRTLNTIEKLKDGDGRYLAETGLLTFDAEGGDGTLLGFPFVTNHPSASQPDARLGDRRVGNLLVAGLGGMLDRRQRRTPDRVSPRKPPTRQTAPPGARRSNRIRPCSG
jgi:HK97 family phage major capsid protein